MNETTFPRDTESHTMQIRLDQGLYRHLVFTKNGSSINRFEIITWPGYLSICGDMGTYTFSRLDDMFNFFRRPGVNLGYWAEKLVSVDKPCGYERYDSKKMHASITKAFESLGEDIQTEIRDDVEEILEDVDDEHDVRRRVFELSYGEDCAAFSDLWEDRCVSYTGQFVWCCHAIHWAILKYDEARPGSVI